MSLDCYLGRRQNLLSETALHARLLHCEPSVLTESHLETLRSLVAFRSQTLSVTFECDAGPLALEAALDKLEHEAISAVAAGITLLILSDNLASPSQAPIPMLMAVCAVYQALIRRGARPYTSFIFETGSAFDIHQVALFLWYCSAASVSNLWPGNARAVG